MDRYDHRRHVYRLPETTRKAIDEALQEYRDGEAYMIASSSRGTYYIDDEALFEALGLK